MDSYKRIELRIGRYLAGRYRMAVEVGIGRNTDVAMMLADAGVLKGCTDIKDTGFPIGLNFFRDDIFVPDLSRYEGADLIYAIRPAIEMVPPLIALAQKVDCDMIVYHLGFEVYGDGGEILDYGVLLHRYWRRSEPVKER
ncbi:MAG: hypothetical protein GX651_03590 [Methanomicrobiales archaeon]|nr:hypothetical protein [Methanomicrobiales archaeon]